MNAAIKKTAVCVGRPITAPALVPVLHRATSACICEPFIACGKVWHVTALHLGTTFAVVLCEDISNMDITQPGAALSTHVLFPQGADILFVQVLDSKRIGVRLWQKMHGEKICTPEAAGAAASAAIMLQEVYSNTAEVEIHAHAGTFRAAWDRWDDTVWVE